MLDIPPTATGPGQLHGLDLAAWAWSDDDIVAFVVGSSGVVRAANLAVARLSGGAPVGRPIVEFVSPGQARGFGAWLRDVGPGWDTRAWGMVHGPDPLPRDHRLSACRAANGEVYVLGYPITSAQVTTALLDANDTLLDEQRRLSRESERLGRVAQTDGLTGLANRRAFDDELAALSATPGNSAPWSLIMMDVDHFKALNDRHGHPTGDLVLRWLAEQLRSASRTGDLVARYGGEEFVAILHGADAAGAAGWAERLRSEISNGVVPGVDGGVTISAGVATWRHGQTGADVLERADQALYRAKHEGRDRVVTDGITSQPRDDDPVTFFEPIWHASAIGAAMIDRTVVRRANQALTSLLGRSLEGAEVATLVHPGQAATFVDWLGSASREWSKAVFGFRPDAQVIPLDRAAWVRRNGRTTELLIEPAELERAAVEQALLALVDDMVDAQRLLERRTHDLEAALLGKRAAEQRASELERLLPLCAWCDRIRHDDGAALKWLSPTEYFAVTGTATTHAICDRCLAEVQATLPSTDDGR